MVIIYTTIITICKFETETVIVFGKISYRHNGGTLTNLLFQLQSPLQKSKNCITNPKTPPCLKHNTNSH